MKETARFRTGAVTANGRIVTIFVSYAHQNRVWMERLRPLLIGMQNDDRGRKLAGLDGVSAWHDTELEAGGRWDQQIKDAMERMTIFVPLVSHDFFASWYIQNVEMPRARQRHENGDIHVVPILLEDVNLREKCEFLSQFSTLPESGRWWRSYRAYGDANRPIDDGLWAAVEKVLGG